jgi:hypothetical protein
MKWIGGILVAASYATASVVGGNMILNVVVGLVTQ